MHTFLTILEGNKFTEVEFLSQILYTFMDILKLVANLSSEISNHVLFIKQSVRIIVSKTLTILCFYIGNSYQSNKPPKGLFFHYYYLFKCFQIFVAHFCSFFLNSCLCSLPCSKFLLRYLSYSYRFIRIV